MLGMALRGHSRAREIRNEFQPIDGGCGFGTPFFAPLTNLWRRLRL